MTPYSVHGAWHPLDWVIGILGGLLICMAALLVFSIAIDWTVF